MKRTHTEQKKDGEGGHTIAEVFNASPTATGHSFKSRLCKCSNVQRLEKSERDGRAGEEANRKKLREEEGMVSILPGS